MSVNALVTNENTPASYLKYMAFGAISGYALKYAIPVTAQERDENFKAELKNIRARVKETRKQEIEAIRKDYKNRDKATDMFLKMNDSKKLRSIDLEKVPEKLLDKIMDLKSGVDYRTKERLYTEIDNLRIITKKIRPTSVFVFGGAAIGAVYALVKNILYRRENPPVEEVKGVQVIV